MRNREAGFSLIELLVVVGILGLVALMIIPNLGNTFRYSVQSSGRELATLIKDTSNAAQITGKIHRVVYDIKNSQYWAESTSEQALLKSEESINLDKDRSHRFDKDKDAKDKKSSFHIEPLLTKKKRTLPIGVKFKDVYTEQSEEPIIDGLAYTHIFPQGMSEKSLIHLEDNGKDQISLVVSNLLGRCTVEGHFIEPKDVFGKGVR